ncbi:hypothetical protein [Candidatus Enterococcus mansonii]|uniref:hypothetical protein n=1 Tax=Candidatus Enterococcus mansonii TaxID=1834181 RepID=UPI0011779A1C|nr:hypothetical protein [Enterococcus sp. 4G2_DIV0659]
MSLIETYFCVSNQKERGLDRWGITIISPASVPAFYDVIIKDKKNYDQFYITELSKLLLKAIDENKYLIHYGV